MRISIAFEDTLLTVYFCFFRWDLTEAPLSFRLKNPNEFLLLENFVRWVEKINPIQFDVYQMHTRLHVIQMVLHLIHNRFAITESMDRFSKGIHKTYLTFFFLDFLSLHDKTAIF